MVTNAHEGQMATTETLQASSELSVLPRACYVILHIGLGPSQLQEPYGSPLIVKDGDRFELSDDIWLERMEEKTAKHVQTACDPPHYRIDGVDHDRHLYAFVMRVPERQQTRFDGLDLLHAVVALSRLVHPTSVGDRYCAQILHYGLEDSAVYAVQYRGASLDVFLSSNQRDWLTVEDGETLRRLMPWRAKDKLMHPRIHRAFWNHEYAMRSSYLDVRWMFVVAGLEALINIGSGVTVQFKKRVYQLAAHFNIVLTVDELEKAYKLRSKLVHAESFLHGLGNIVPTNEHNPLYEKLETVLRLTVKQALLDDNFANFFRDDVAVRARWKC
jgi:hypothetical protein